MMSKIYYHGNTPMLKYKSGNVPCAVPIDKIAADAIESLEARVKQLEAALKALSDDEWWDMETPSTAADFARAALQNINGPCPNSKVAKHIAHLKSWNEIRWDEDGNQLGGNLNDAKTIDLLERQARENAKLDKMLSDIADESTGRLETIGELQQRIEQLEAELAKSNE